MRIPLALATLTVAVGGCGFTPPPAPVQPVEFSHRVHAGDAHIGCTSCHAYAEHSPVAGIPSMQRCQGCHKFIRQDPQNPRIAEQLKPLLAALREDRVVEWTRVYRLPDHVFFTHERHVAAGIRCQECHGEVERTEAVRQESSLLMGWCLECHWRKQAERPIERAKLTYCWTCHK